MKFHDPCIRADSPLTSRDDSNESLLQDVERVETKDVQTVEQEAKKAVEELPPPITVPQTNSPSPLPAAPPTTSTLPPPDVAQPTSPLGVPLAPAVSPAQLLPARHLDLHPAMQPLFPHEYPRGYPATGFPPPPYPVDDMYGETVNIVRPGYVSPTNFMPTTTPYWTRPPEFHTQQSVYEVENEHGIRPEEVRSMNIVRELFNRIGKQVLKEEVPPYIAGPMPSVPGGPDRERSIGMWQIAMLLLWFALRQICLLSVQQFLEDDCGTVCTETFSLVSLTVWFSLDL